MVRRNSNSIRYLAEAMSANAGNGKTGSKMPDYIYLLENRLSADQRNALRQLREATREAGIILFLTGDAVRDLTSGDAIRSLEVTVHGNALKLKKTIEKFGGIVWGEEAVSRSLYLCFPGTVRADVISSHRVEYPKPGQPVSHPASIQDDLRRRDFTVNAMAISLNEGSFGLLMDPLNGAADIESRTLRLVSNYGFLEDPSLLIRATRYHARLGWEMDAKTRTRYENAKGEEVIQNLSTLARSQELEQIGHEEDGLKVLRALQAEGWMKVLFPAWTADKADEERLKSLHELALELLLQGIHSDMSAAQMELLTAGLAPKDLASLKKLMLRPGFVKEWNSLDALAAGFAKTLLAKENAIPSACYKLFTSYDPEAILWLGFTSKDAAVRERYNQFLKVWPGVRQRIPHALMQEMRITQELATYNEIVQNVFLELIDDRLSTPEEARAFLDPHSPPAPPPKETTKRPRVKRSVEAKVKEQSYDDDEEAEVDLDEDEDLDDLGVDLGGDEVEIDLGLSIPKVELDEPTEEDGESADDDSEEAEPLPVKQAPKAPATAPKTPLHAPKMPLPALKMPAPAPAPTKPAPAHKEKPAPAAKTKESKKPQAASPSKTEVKPKVELKPKADLKPKTGSKIKVQPKLKAGSKPGSASASSAKSSKAVTKPAKAKGKIEAQISATKAPVKPGKKVASKPPAKAALAKAKPVPVASAKAKHPSPPTKPSKPAPKGASTKPVKKH
jgi:tRNA nucleotidyltransferase (CCA-adding enzyme)